MSQDQIIKAMSAREALQFVHRIVQEALTKRAQLPELLVVSSSAQKQNSADCSISPDGRVLSVTEYKMQQVLSEAKQVLETMGSIQSQSDDSFNATKVMLYLNDDQEAALTYRKAYFCDLISRNEMESKTVAITGSREDDFVARLLLVPHRNVDQNASKTLWDYRAWVLSTFQRMNVPHPSNISGMPLPYVAARACIIDSELPTMFEVAEKFDDSENAFQYGRKLLDLYRQTLKVEKSRGWYPDMVREMVAEVISWNKKQPSRRHAWAYLFFLLCDTEEDDTVRFAVKKIEEIMEWGMKTEQKGKPVLDFLRMIAASDLATSRFAKPDLTERLDAEIKKLRLTR